jgi:hypothetical protein
MPPPKVITARFNKNVQAMVYLEIVQPKNTYCSTRFKHNFVYPQYIRFIENQLRPKIYDYFN